VVLIDRRTGSAAEFVAYSLQALGRARIVGTRSGGAAHMFDDPVLLPDGYQISIPDRQPINLRTGGNWERTGVRLMWQAATIRCSSRGNCWRRRSRQDERTIARLSYRRCANACLESKHPGSSRALRVNGLNEDSVDRQFRADRARDLRRAGGAHEVVGLDRSPFATTRIIADVTDRQAVVRAVQGVDAVIHTAPCMHRMSAWCRTRCSSRSTWRPPRTCCRPRARPVRGGSC
jgi:hypothetical protein